jgi:quinol monooxygenase YgiN
VLGSLRGETGRPCSPKPAASNTARRSTSRTWERRPYWPDAFVVIEKWESPDHLKAHAAAPHMKAYGAKTKDMLAGRVIHVLAPV